MRSLTAKRVIVRGVYCLWKTAMLGVTAELDAQRAERGNRIASYRFIRLVQSGGKVEQPHGIIRSRLKKGRAREPYGIIR